MIDEKKLLSYKIPDIRQPLTAEDAAFYALSIGLGYDPQDEKQLDYVDPQRPTFKVLPCMNEVLCHAGFWLANPDVGVNALQLLHGEQAIEWYRPLPAKGRLKGTTRVTDLVDKGKDKGALLYATKEITDEDSGELIAKSMRCIFLRADGGFGGSKTVSPRPHKLPESKPDYQVDLETRPEQALYYRLNGDNNPIHVNPEAAKKAGFDRPILHGLCTYGVVFHALLRQFADYQAVNSGALQLRFSSPVFPGETIRVEMWKDGSFRARVVERDKLVINNGLVRFDL